MKKPKPIIIYPARDRGYAISLEEIFANGVPSRNRSTDIFLEQTIANDVSSRNRSTDIAINTTTNPTRIVSLKEILLYIQTSMPTSELFKTSERIRNPITNLEKDIKVIFKETNTYFIERTNINIEKFNSNVTQIKELQKKQEIISKELKDETTKLYKGLLDFQKIHSSPQLLFSDTNLTKENVFNKFDNKSSRFELFNNRIIYLFKVELFIGLHKKSINLNYTQDFSTTYSMNILENEIDRLIKNEFNTYGIKFKIKIFSLFNELNKIKKFNLEELFLGRIIL